MSKEGKDRDTNPDTAPDLPHNKDTGMVDHDDDGFDGPFSESDDGHRSESGYSGVEEDFDDPLADWPGTDSSTDWKEPTHDQASGEHALVQVGLGHRESPYENKSREARELAFPDDDHSEEEDDFVDAFLDDLDPPARPDGPIPADALAISGAALSAPSSLLATGGGSASRTVERLGNLLNSRTGDASADDGLETATRHRDNQRALSPAMIALVIAALVLLAVGGYGVIQQRESMQAEIRDLQSRLATAMSPDESTVIREQQRQLEVDYEALSADFAALEVDNEQLRAQIFAQQEILTEKLQPVSQANIEENPSTKAAGTAGSDPTDVDAATAVGPGGWFVNFGSYTLRDDAERWAKRLEVEQGTVTVQAASANGSTLYRVRIVGLPGRDNAERVAMRLEREFELPRLWIGTQTP